MSVLNAAQEFLRLEGQLLLHHAVAAARVTSEVSNLLDCTTADAESAWGVLWDKPVRAARKWKGADTIVNKARPLMTGTWQETGPGGALHVEKVVPAGGKKLHWKKPENYSYTGPLVRDLTSKGVPLFAIYGINTAGMHFRTLADNNSAPFSIFDRPEPLGDRVLELQEKFGGVGSGWGDVTVLHFLTGLGLACKPDLHLVKTVRALGFRTRRSKTPSFQDDIAINVFIDELIPLVYPNEEVKRARRRLDKTLMEISVVGLV